MSSTFPFPEQFTFRDHRSGGGVRATATAAQVIEQLRPMLTPDRLQKIDRVVSSRTFNISVVLENLYDRGNASAVIRSAESMGFAQVHSIEPGDKFKESQRTTAGADKWVELRRWKTTAECVQHLHGLGQQIIVTHLDSTSKPIAEIDFSKPSAFVLGNEKDGVSPEMIAAADHRVILPMVGFTQSYNISVAAALGLYHIFQDRQQRLGHQGDLSEDQQQILRALYYLRTQPSGEDVLVQRYGKK